MADSSGVKYWPNAANSTTLVARLHARERQQFGRLAVGIARRMRRPGGPSTATASRT